MTGSNWVTGASGAKHSYQLWVGDMSVSANKIDITPDDNSASSVVDAINANATAAAKITATMVNLGTANAPDYRVQLQGDSPGALALDIVDANLQNQTTTGELAQYVVNNS